MFDQLNQIKALREDNAHRKYKSSEAEHNKAKKAQFKQEVALEEYKVWRVAEKNRRYDSLVGQSLSMQDLKDFNRELLELDVKQQEMEKMCQQAKQTTQQKLSEVNTTKSSLDHARLQVKKFKALAEEDKKRLQHLAILEEDNALDEFVVKKQLGLEDKM